MSFLNRLISFPRFFIFNFFISLFFFFPVGVACFFRHSKWLCDYTSKVSALQAVVDGGTKIDDKDIVYVTEMLMRQLLKLDGIEAEGEGKVQRKMEVSRVFYICG